MLDLLPDLFDLYPDKLQLLNLQLNNYGGKSIFYGQIETVRCFEDNSKVKQVLATAGQGRILVVDGEGSCKKALLGDLIAQSAVDNGWAGVVIYGGVRDVGTIQTMDLGVKASGAVPIKTERRDQGAIGDAIVFGDVTVRSGMYLYADLNGVAVSNEALEVSV